MPYRGGQVDISGAVIAIFDINDLYSIHKKLAEQSRIFGNLMDRQEELIYHLDKVGQIKFVNAALIDFCSMTEDNIVGSNFGELLTKKPRGMFETALNEISDDEPCQLELSMRGTNGKMRKLEVDNDSPK